MKNILALIFSFLALTIFIAACKKGNTNSKINSLITLSKASIKRGEQVYATADMANGSSIVKWTVRPSNYAQVLSSNASAIAIFAIAGKYQITASYYSSADTTLAYDSSIAPIVVTDSIFLASTVVSTTDSLIISADQIALTPVFASDSGLVMSAQTSDLYNCSAYITAYGWEQGQSTVGFLFNSAEAVESIGNCNGARNPAISYIFFTALANGTYSVSANYKQVNYQGSLTVTDTDFTFYWNYTTGIVISPLNIKRQ
jgi:hypothetical protein